MSTFGVLAQFKNPAELLHAAEKVRDKGITKFDCYSPFPIHGLDDAMGLKRSILGYLVGISAFLGAAIGLGLQWWSSVIAYPMVISGKPLFSWQAFIIITFGLMVIGGAFASVFGMFGLNKLPTYHHPLFNSVNFEKATDDGFFICIESDDTNYNEKDTVKFLESLGGSNLEIIHN
jgi:hypothetical protein